MKIQEARVLALFLAMGIAPPDSASALRVRAGGLEEGTPTVDALARALGHALPATPAAGLEEKLQQVKEYLGITALEPDESLDAVMKTPEETILLRAVSATARYWRGALIHSLLGQDGEQPPSVSKSHWSAPNFPGGLYSNAAAMAVSGRSGEKSPLEISREIMQRFANKHGGTLGGIILVSRHGIFRGEEGDPFLSFSRSIDDVFEFLGLGGDSAILVIKIPKGQWIIDRSLGPERAVLIPHLVPRRWVVAIVTNSKDFLKSLNVPSVKRVWKGKAIFESALNRTTIAKRLEELGFRDRNFLPSGPRLPNPFSSGKGRGEGAGDPILLDVRWDLGRPEGRVFDSHRNKTRFWVYPGQTLGQAIRSYLWLHREIFSGGSGEWVFFLEKPGKPGRKQIKPGTRLPEGSTVLLMKFPFLGESTPAGLEELFFKTQADFSESQAEAGELSSGA